MTETRHNYSSSDILDRLLEERIVAAGIVTPDELGLARKHQLEAMANGEMLSLAHVLSDMNLADSMSIERIIVEIINLQKAEATAHKNLFVESESQLKTTHIMMAAYNQIGQAVSYREVFQTMGETFSKLGLVCNEWRTKGRYLYPSESYLPTISSEITHRVVGEQSSHNQQILSSELEIALTLHPSLTVFQLDTTLDGFEPLARVLRIAECKYATFLPVRTGTTLSGIIAIGAWEKQALKPEVQELINLLISFAGTVLGRIDTLISMQKQLAVLQTIYTAGKVIGEETKLDNLYRLIHEEVESVIGKIDFMIALYEPENNRIDIPYVKEGDQYLTLPAIPYGQGLISIPIRTHQPLMLVEDTRQQALELGVEVTGTAPKSWLGVPLLVSGEAIGVMIAQDFEHEHRFDDEDQRLLNTLAVQIAITIRNARLLSETQHRAHLDRQLHEITNRIRTSTDIPTILKTTVNELAQTFGARRVRIEIGEGGAGSPDTESGEGSDLEDRL